MSGPAAIVGQYAQYGSLLYVNPTGQDLAANPQPVYPFTIQDLSITVKGKPDSLRGQQRLAEDVAIGDIEVTGKFGIGRKDWLVFQQMFLADTTNTGGSAVQPLEPHLIPTTPYEITIAPPGSGTFAEDLGVMYSPSGKRFVPVASVAGAGQYSQTAGVYTFDSADGAGTVAVVISYLYTLTTGETYQMNNQFQGYGPQLEFFCVDRYQQTGGIPNSIWLKAVKVHALGDIGSKRDKYAMMEVEFTAFAPGPIGGQLLQAFVAAG